MRPLYWFVLLGCLTLVVGYGTWRGHGSNTVKKYVLASNSMPWYAIAFSIMATQASAITLISTTGPSYVDGMRFVQFYFGLPIAMVILSVTLVPLSIEPRFTPPTSTSSTGSMPRPAPSRASFS